VRKDRLVLVDLGREDLQELGEVLEELGWGVARHAAKADIAWVHAYPGGEGEQV
jgi:hypothetical protein